MYLPSFPQIGRDFHASMSSVEMTLSIFLAGMALGQLLHGPLSDRYGRRPLLQAGTAIFALAALGCCYAGSIAALMLWRLLMALGGAAGQTVARAIVRDWFEEREAARYFSLLLAITGAAPILAPFLGGQILEYAGWRGIFGLLAGFGALCCITVTWALPESLPKERRHTGGTNQAIRLYGRLLANGHFVSSIAALGFAYAAMFSYITGSSAVFITGLGVSPQNFGLFFGANALGMIGASQWNRRLLRSISPRRILAVAYGLLVVFAVLLVWVGVRQGIWIFAVVLWVCVSLLGFLLPNLAALSLAPLGHAAGSASALLGMAQFGLGSASGLALSVLAGSPAHALSAAVAAFAAAGFAALCATPMLQRRAAAISA